MVTRAGPERLRDLIEVRIVNETAALRLSIEHGDLDWEASVVAAHNRLAALGPEEFDRCFQRTSHFTNN